MPKSASTLPRELERLRLGFGLWDVASPSAFFAKLPPMGSLSALRCPERPCRGAPCYPALPVCSFVALAQAWAAVPRMQAHMARTGHDPSSCNT